MKTVMQEMIDYAKSVWGWDEEFELKANELLKKEKQRLFHCFNAGADRVCDKEFNEWFNQNYNQDKLTIKTDGKVGLSNPDETTNDKLTINQNK